MNLNLTPNGDLLDLWRVNKKGDRVYPHVQGRKNTTERGFCVTLSGRKCDYRPMSLEEFLGHLATGHLLDRGRVRMKPIGGGQNNGFSLKCAFMSDALERELRKRRLGFI